MKRKACVTCTTVKTKCIPLDASVCQRCARLGKSCVYLDLPKTKRKSTANSSRVEMLEKKVEQLMCQIAQVTSGTARDNTIQSNDAPEASHNRENDSPEAMDIISAAHGADPPTVSASERQPSVIDRGLLNQVEAELLVSKFRREFGTKFPFVVLQDNETAAMLAEKQQFLFMCIAAATLSSAHPARRVVCNDIVKQVSLRVLEHSERNLELLQGIMISCAWYSYPSLKGHPQLLLFVQLCVTILHDLGLHAKHDLTADEQRAFLGTYWLSVGLSRTLLRPLLAMKHCKRVDECVATFEKPTQHLSDQYIPFLVRLNSFVTVIDESHDLLDSSEANSVLIQTTQVSLQRQFELLKSSVEIMALECSIEMIPLIHSDLKYLQIRIDALSLADEIWDNAASAIPIRTRMLLNLIQRSQEIICQISDLPDTEIAQINIMTAAQLCGAIQWIPMAVLILIRPNMRGSPSETNSVDAHIYEQAVIDAAAAYSNAMTRIVKSLERRNSRGEKSEAEMDIIESLTTKMRILPECLSRQVQASAEVGPSPRSSEQNARMTATQSCMVDSSESIPDLAQPWTPDESILDGISFPLNDAQWATILKDIGGISY